MTDMKRHTSAAYNSSTYAEWMWKANLDPFSSLEKEEWCSYSEEESRIIERAHQNGECYVRLNSRYEIDFDRLVQIVVEDRRRQRPVKRVVHNKESWIKLGYKIGEGGFGKVYQGIYRERQEVACKVTKTQLSEADRNEINILKTLHHPNIIRYIDVIYTSQKMLIVMELIDGGTLLTYIRETPESWNFWCNSRNIMIDVAYGMCYLHEKNTVHADLKSDNILLRQNGKAVVTDFGLSKITEDSRTQNSGENSGAVRWLAPELCSSRPESSSFQSDVWAFGCVLLEMITNRWPWQKEYEHDSQMLHALSQGKNATFFQEICRKKPAPEKIRRILCACCTWPKSNRPTFVDLIRELNSIHDTDLDSRNERQPVRVQTALTRPTGDRDPPYTKESFYNSINDEDNFTSADSRKHTYSSYRNNYAHDTDDSDH